MAHSEGRKPGSGILDEIEANRVGFSLAFIGIFTLSFVFLAVMGVVPDPTLRWQSEHGGAPLSQTSGNASSSVPSTSSAVGEEPVRIVVDSISLDRTVSNPTSTDVAVLDDALLIGAVRYPTSATLGVNGTVLLFGHSSYLPIVHNQAYKTFDGIQNLRTGDEVSVYSSDKEYRYQVTGVRTANADDQNESTIALPADGEHLTLITCDSFGTKSDRYVVTADFVGTYSLAS